jgi:hypothetical protein
MTDEEKRIITAFVERLSGNAAVQGAASGPWGASAAQKPNLPPMDPDADRLIGELFARYPEARYRITQSAFAQEAALVEANNRIQQLEWEAEAARREGQAQKGGMLGGLFGGNRPAPMPPRPQPYYPPGHNPQALQQRPGGGFLGTALATAAGVAGGIMLGNMLMGALGGGGAAQAASAGGFAQEAVPSSSPWGGDAQPETTADYGNDASADWGDEEQL